MNTKILLKNIKMFKQQEIIDYANKIDIPIIGFSLYQNNVEQYKKRVEHKKTTNTLYPRNQSIEQYYNLNLVLDDAKSIISIGIPYCQSAKFEYEKNKATFSITSYGLDYHKLIFTKMENIISFLKAKDNSIKYYYQCDTGVLDDRYFAYLCGNGSYGKHSQIINPQYGSQIFFGTIILDKLIDDIETNIINDLCQDCSLCLDACPTNSINNYQLDYRSCLSYLSQSHNLFNPQLVNNCFYGCDICSNICPYNKPNSYNKAFEEANPTIDILDFLLLSKNEYLKYYKNKGFSWLNRNILRKNMILLLELENKDFLELEEKVIKSNSSVLLKEAFNYQKNRK